VGPLVDRRAIIFSAVVVVMFLVTGWLGGELVFRPRIGVVGDESKALRSAAGARTTASTSAMQADGGH
jgi:hypothetical protein